MSNICRQCGKVIVNRHDARAYMSACWRRTTIKDTYQPLVVSPPDCATLQRPTIDDEFRQETPLPQDSI